MSSSTFRGQKTRVSKGPAREWGRSEFGFEKIHQAVLNIGGEARVAI